MLCSLIISFVTFSNMWQGVVSHFVVQQSILNVETDYI